MPIDYPEIEEFIDLRRHTGGDTNRKALNIHHGIAVTDTFMQAVEIDEEFPLVSPDTKKVVRVVKARDIWVKLLTTRIETGEPYIIFIDTINKYIPEHHKKLGLQVKTSNLCSEITLPTGIDHLGKSRTAVCCLSSVNLEYFDDWQNDPEFILMVMHFLDNVLEDFIIKAPSTMERAKYSAMREHSVGLWVILSTIVFVALGIPNISPHSSNLKCVVIISEDCSYNLANSSNNKNVTSGFIGTYPSSSITTRLNLLSESMNFIS